MFVLLVALASIVISLIYIWLKNINADYWKKRNIVYVKKTNPFGLTLDYVLNNQPISVLYKEILDEHPTEDHVGVFHGRRPGLLIKDSVNIQAVMAGDFINFYDRGVKCHPDDKLADNVLLMNNYTRWKLVRQKLTPLFTSAKLKNMFYIIEHCAKDFVKHVGERKDSGVKPNEIIYPYSASTIAASVFGLDPKLKNAMDSPFVQIANTAFADRKILMLLLYLWPELIDILGIKQFAAHEDFFINIVKKMLRNRESENVKGHDFIDLCVELQKNGTMKDPVSNYELEPTDELIAAQAFFFFVAGIDTATTTLSFTLFELSKNPDILAKLHREIDETFSRNGGDNIPYEELQSMPYIEMVLSESMRKYPAIGSLQRQCTNDTILPSGGITMKKNTLAIVPVFALHRDPRYFPDPDKFDPERFSPDNIDKIVKYTYFPFGEGNRICIGARFAKTQMKTGLAYLLRRYTLQLISDEVKFEKSIFAIKAPGLAYKFVDRKTIN